MLGEFIDTSRLAQLSRGARAQPEPWLLFDPATLGTHYNRRPFVLDHRLAQHPDFALPALFDLCRRLDPVLVKRRVAVVPDDTDFDRSLDAYNHGLSVDDAIAHLEDGQGYIVVNNPERDPTYRLIIEGLLGEIAAAISPHEPGLNWYSTYLFITARDAVTPYHMDREMNFLLQIHGHKNVRLWDPFDDEVMSPADKDRLLADRAHRRPGYRPALDAKAMVYDLTPGIGVHHPFIAPHLVTTGSALSVSLAFTFRTARSDVWTDAHVFNHKLRRLGLAPAPVGTNLLRDATKARLIRLARRMRRLARGAEPEDEE